MINTFIRGNNEKNKHIIHTVLYFMDMINIK